MKKIKFLIPILLLLLLILPFLFQFILSKKHTDFIAEHFGFQKNEFTIVEDSARFFGCQFVIATHSPFLLSMPQAKIYDLDEEIVDVKKWFELANVRAYYEFFKKHAHEFTKIKNEL